MIDLIKQEAARHGDKLQILPIERLKDLQKDIALFGHTEELNGFQKTIISSIYQMGVPDTIFPVHSIIIIASPCPAHAKVVFEWQGKKVLLKSLARAYTGKKEAHAATEEYLTKLCTKEGYHIRHAPKLPLKRIAVASGLAQYGRNNITYVEGMGSFLTLNAYFTDIKCEIDPWQKISNMERCKSCRACIKSCPTGAIRQERFLIDNERCLSFFNESPGEFPEWLPKSIHHCLYDCLICQNACPQNRAYLGNTIGPIEFDETETESLLSGMPLERMPAALKEKVVFLGMDEWIEAIPRNLKVLLENYASI